MKQKKIIIVASYAESLVNFRLQLMLEFIIKGYEVVALAPFDSIVCKTLAELNIRFIPLELKRNGTNPLSDFKLYFQLKKIFSQEKPNIVLSYTIKPVIYASLAAKSKGIQQIYSLMTGTGYVFTNETIKSKIVGFIARKLLKLALNHNTRVFFQNSDNLNFFQTENIINKMKPVTVVNGSGVDCNLFCPAPLPSSISFLMIGRLLSYKGVREYVSAAKTLRHKYPEIIFRLVGWIDTNPESISQEELEHWINEGNVEFLGKLDDVRESIAQSSVYVLPSWNEGMPRTVLEAMAMGRPIITTDTPGCKDTVRKNYNGILVPGKNIPALIESMEYFILNPQKILTMGKASRELALEKFDVNKVNKDMLVEMT